MENKIEKVQKRDGTIVDFDQNRIEEAIFKALTASGEGDGKKAKRLSKKVVQILNRRFKKGEIPHVEQIQDIVEEVLILEGLVKAAKAYILYREQRRRIREAIKVSEEAVDRLDQYIEKLDWEVQENANMAFSLQGLNHYGVTYIIKKYWLNKIYPPEIREAHESGDFHIHNLDTLGPYTFFGKEVVIAKLNGDIKLLSLENLYEEILEPEVLLNEKDEAFAKYPKDLFVLDRNGWTKVLRIVRKRKDREMRFIKSEQGQSVIVTDNHPFIVKERPEASEKEIEAKEVQVKNHLILSCHIPSLLAVERLFFKKHIYLAEELLKRNYENFFLEGFDWKDFIENWGGSLRAEGTISTSNSANSLNNKLELTEDFGYLVGFFIAEGNYESWRLSITTSEKEIIEKIQRICTRLGVRSYVKEKEGETKDISINSSTLKLVFEKIFQIKPLSKNKNLPFDILTYNLDFIRGLIAGIIDGDGTLSTEKTQIIIRVTSRTMLEQLAILLQFFGIVPRTGASTKDIGKKRDFRGKEIIQNYPLYRLTFSKKENVNFPSFKYQKAKPAKKHWRSEDYGWNRVLNNNVTTIPDKFIYDITTESNTFLCNSLLVHNCMGWDLYDLLIKGFGGVPGKVESKPPKHFNTALMQCVNFLYTLQGECYSEDTQVLTENGWKYFYEVKKGEKVYTLNPETNKIELQEPYRFYEYDNRKELLHFKGEKIDLLVTPGHRMLIKEKGKNLLKFVEAQNFDYKNHFLPISENKFAKVSSNPGIKKIKYSGKVYCLEVPNHTLYVRRNGKALWCGNCAGAVSFSNFDTLLAPFIRYDNLNYQQVKQALQEFLFNMAIPTRVGFQTPFSNITLDLKPSPVYAKLPVIIGGKPQEKTYSEFEEEMKIFNRALYEVYMEGDAKGRVFTFPIPTINITKDFPWDEPAFNGIFEASAKYGINYFANYINSEMKPEDVRSMCIEANEEILIRNSKKIKRLSIKEVAESYKDGDFDKEGWAGCKKEGNLEVLSLNPETLKLEWAPVKRFLKIKDNKAVEVITEDGKISLFSLKHPVSVYTPEGIKMKFAKDLQKGDFLLTIKRANEKIFSKEYQKIENLVLNEDLAKILGYFVADGNYLFESRKRYTHFGEPKGMRFTFKSGDRKNLKEIKHLLKKVFNVTTHEKRDPRYNTYYLYVYNAEIARKLYKAGFRKYGRLPQILFNSPKSVIESFLELYFRGDGYEKRKEIHLNDLELSRDLVLLFSLVGRPVTYKLRKKSQRIYLQHAKSKIKKENGWLNNPILAERVPDWMAVSTAKVPGLAKSRTVGLNTLEKYNAHTEESLKIKNSDIYLVRVKEIKIQKFKQLKEFYDIELEKNHLFVHSLGQISFNCCRLRLDLTELYNRGGGGLFGSGSKTGCYDEKTEILTENGWKYFKDLTLEDRVFTLTDDNKIELHHPIRLFEYNYEGKMIHFKSRAFDLLVTPNHRMVVDHKYKGKRMFVEAKDFKPYQHYIPKGGIWEGEEKEWFILPPVVILGGAGPQSKFSEEELQIIRQLKNEGKTIYQIAESFNCSPVAISNVCTKENYGNRERVRIRYEAPPLKIKMDDWLKFFGFWLAEGSTDNEKIAPDHGYRVVISQKNKEKREEIKEVLNRLPFNYSEEKDTFVIHNKQLWAYLRQFGNKYTKFIPKEIKNLSKRQLKILFDWMVKGDGYVRKTNGQINYWTASKRLADDLQEIILKLGWHATIKERRRKISQIKGREVKTNVVYEIGVHRKTKHFTFTHKEMIKNQIRKVYYKGKVYCCEVPNHTVYVRRNGKATWCGNSIGVVTINLPRIGYLSKTKKEFFERLAKVMDLAKESLEIKRKALENYMEKGLYPYSRYYLQDVKRLRGKYWANHFSTIGLVGMNECLLNFMGEDIASKRGRRFALEVLDFMRERLVKYQKETGNIYNLEQTPAESTAYRLALKDKERYPDIITAGTKKVPYYTNSSQLPVNYTDDIFKALQLQDELQCKYTGGSVFHIFLGERLPNGEMVKKLVKKIFENFKLPYITITPTFSICPVHGYLPGEHFFCPKCLIKQPCEVYTRVVGYLRPVNQFNIGKQQEYKERKMFKI